VSDKVLIVFRSRYYISFQTRGSRGPVRRGCQLSIARMK
jgi:hypothetical protein